MTFKLKCLLRSSIIRHLKRSMIEVDKRVVKASGSEGYSDDANINVHSSRWLQRERLRIRWPRRNIYYVLKKRILRLRRWLRFICRMGGAYLVAVIERKMSVFMTLGGFLLDGGLDGAFGGVGEEEIPKSVCQNAEIIVEPRWDSGQLHRNSGGHSGRIPHYTKDFPLKEEEKTLKEAYYTQFGRPFQGGGYRAATLGFYQRNNVNPSYQERRQSMEDALRKFMSESTKIHEENSNLIKEIRASTDAAIRNQGASIKTLEIQIRKMSKVLHERGFGSLPSSTKENPRDQVKSISTTVEADSYPIRASISVMPLSTYLNLGLGGLAHTKLTVELTDRTVKYPKGIVENMLVRIGKFVFSIKFIILDMPEDIKVPLILRRPFLTTAHAKIDVFKRKITLRVGEERIIFKSIKPASSLIKRVYMLSLRERMELDLEARLMGETLVFAFLEDMDAYCDEGMGDVIVGKPFLKEIGIKERRFEGMITIYNGKDEVTYQMVRSHLRFKQHTNEQCNKIPPLLKVSKEDKMNGISHAYQKLKGFYKGVLNLRPDYIRDEKIEE
ncbi:DNA-directed DNA polymerase [Tanacetum coccineum]